jgi:hypothetical protein
MAAQERSGTVQVLVSTDRADWLYEPGAPVRFRIVAVHDGHPLAGVKVNYRIGPEKIQPTQQDPADFDAFWAAGKMAPAMFPMAAMLTPLPEYGIDGADCYQVNLQNVEMSAAPSRFTRFCASRRLRAGIRCC